MNRIPPLSDLQVGFGEVFASFRRLKPTSVHIYAASLVVAALASALALVGTGHGLNSPWAVVALASVAALAERSRVQFGDRVEGSISLLPSLFAAVLFGPLAAMLVGASSFAGHFGRPFLKWTVYTSSRAITWAASGLLAGAAEGLADNRFGALAVAAAVGALASNMVDTAFAAIAFRLRGYGSARSVFAKVAPLALASVPLFTPLVVLLAYAYERSPWTLPFFFVPALGAQRLFLLYQEQRQLAVDLAQVNERLERANLSFATALVATLDARDQYSAGHSAAVAIYARDIAARLGLTEKEQELAHQCGLVHDIGKVGLPPGLLEKDGPLTLDERRHMQRHPEIGERILANVDDYAEIAAIVRHHHARWDGKGYPDKLVGEEIPLLSRIIAVADAYNAMTSNRPYRNAMKSQVARMRLAQAVESQFDTGVVAAFEAVLAGADEQYRTGKRSDFSLSVQDPWTEEIVPTIRAA